jgi:hypothetical protein
MMKFYKGARRILAGQKKMSTILIAKGNTMGSPLTGKKLTGSEWAGRPAGQGIQSGGVVEKLRMGVDKWGHFFSVLSHDVILNRGEATVRDLTMRVRRRGGSRGLGDARTLYLIPPAAP